MSLAPYYVICLIDLSSPSAHHITPSTSATVTSHGPAYMYVSEGIVLNVTLATTPSSPSIYRYAVPLPASRTNTPLGLDSVGE